MFTENNVKMYRSSENCVCYKINVKDFYLMRSSNKYTLDEFLKIANELYLEKFGIEADHKGIDSTTKKKGTTDYEIIIRNRWSSLNQRCSGGKYANEPSVQNNLQHISYKKKNIRLEMSKDEFYDWMMSVKHIHDEIVANGDKSSINRINPLGNYSLDNIELIALHKNIEERYGKECEYDVDKEKFRKQNARAYRKSQNKGDE